MSGTAREQANRTDRLSPDHLPACPRCHDLNEREAETCGSCGTHLTRRARVLAASGGDPAQADLVAQLLQRAPLFHCHNCLRDWIEPFCDECGAGLMPTATGAVASSREGVATTPDHREVTE